ncbi:hypothetical protein ACFIQG_10295 [Comamonas odontotermitis]|uniref:hypothetical protein n=1 Tax=Comamonas odontotermitis TaxID=379895 RepID=UPI00366AA60F
MSNDKEPNDSISGAISLIADMLEGYTVASLVADVALAKTLLDRGIITTAEFHNNLDTYQRALSEEMPNRFADTLINSVKRITNDGK